MKSPNTSRQEATKTPTKTLPCRIRGNSTGLQRLAWAAAVVGAVISTGCEKKLTKDEAESAIRAKHYTAYKKHQDCKWKAMLDAEKAGEDTVYTAARSRSECVSDARQK